MTDFRFLRTFGRIFAVLLIWLPVMMVGIVGLALLIHASPGRSGDTVRFVSRLPGALAGVANSVLWVDLLNPSQSPLGALSNAMDLTTIKDVVALNGNLPVSLAGMLFFRASAPGSSSSTAG